MVRASSPAKLRPWSELTAKMVMRVVPGLVIYGKWEGNFREVVGELLRIIDLLMGLFRGAVFRHGGGALKQPIKQPTETPTSTLALMGRFPLLMGRFPTLMGRFTDFVLRGRFTLLKIHWKTALS